MLWAAMYLKTASAIKDRVTKAYPPWWNRGSSCIPKHRIDTKAVQTPFVHESKPAITVKTATGPSIQTLKANRVDLSSAERSKVINAGAVWHFSKSHPTPAVWKAVIHGQTYFFSATHRCYEVAKTVEEAIKQWHEVVEPSA